MKKLLLSLQVLLCTFTVFGQTPPEISGMNCKDGFETNMYPQEKICFNICTSDTDGDQVTVEASFSMPEATFDVLNKGAENEMGRFCWTPEENSDSNSPYIVRFTAKDQTGLTSTVTVKINVLEIAKISTEFSETGCGEGTLTVEEQSNDVISQLSIQGKFYPFVKGTKNYYQLSGLPSGESTVLIGTITTGGYNPQFSPEVNLTGGKVFKRDQMNEFQCSGKTLLVPVYEALDDRTEFTWDDGNKSRYRPFNIKDDSVVYVYGQNGTCFDTLKVALNVAKIEAGFTANPGVGTAPLEVSFTNESAEDADEFYWEFGDGSFSREEHPVHTFTSEGDYSVTLVTGRNRLSCKDTLTFENYINTFPVGIGEPSSEKSFSVYPNPGREFIYANTEGFDVKGAYLMDLRGKTLKIPSELFGTQIRFDIETLDIGSYIVVLQTTDAIYQETFVVGP